MIALWLSAKRQNESNISCCVQMSHVPEGGTGTQISAGRSTSETFQIGIFTTECCLSCRFLFAGIILSVEAAELTLESLPKPGKPHSAVGTKAPCGLGPAGFGRRI